MFKKFTLILASIGLTMTLFACNEEKSDNYSAETEDTSVLEEEDLLPSFMNWQTEQLFLVEPTVAEPMDHSESEKLDNSYLATESLSHMEEDGMNPIFYSFEGDQLKTGHLIMSDEISGSPEEGKVAFGSDDMEYKVEEHKISAINFEEGIYTVETDDEEYELTVESETELKDQYGNRFTIFDSTFSELFEEFS